MERVVFTEEMKKTHTILIPTMLPIHFNMMVQIMRQNGYKAELLTNDSHAVIDQGLRNVHNDTCYPALLVIGQMIDALESGRYDLDKVALLITQTGGGCRASNYIHLLRKALVKSGYGKIPVISLSFTAVAVTGMALMGLSLVWRFSAGAEELANENTRRMLSQVNMNLDSYLRRMMRISDTVYYRLIKNTDLAEGSLDAGLDLTEGLG